MSVFDPVILSQLQQLAKSTADAAAALSAAVANVDGDVATVSGKVTTVNTAVGTVSGQVTGVNTAVAALQGTVNAINSTVNAINAAGGIKSIKSIQRGVTIGPINTTSLTVPITPVNPGKATLQYVPFGQDGYLRASLAANGASVAMVSELAENTLKGVSWEVVEFY